MPGQVRSGRCERIESHDEGGWTLMLANGRCMNIGSDLRVEFVALQCDVCPQHEAALAGRLGLTGYLKASAYSRAHFTHAPSAENRNSDRVIGVSASATRLGSALPATITPRIALASNFLGGKRHMYGWHLGTVGRVLIQPFAAQWSSRASG